FPGAINVVRVAPGQAADDRPLDLAGDGLHGFEIARRGDGETSLNHVHPEVLEGVGDLQFLCQVHAGPWTLFAVSQGRVEDNQALVRHDRGSHKTKKALESEGPRAGVSELIVPANGGVPRTSPPLGAAKGPVAAYSDTPSCFHTRAGRFNQER